MKKWAGALVVSLLLHVLLLAGLPLFAHSPPAPKPPVLLKVSLQAVRSAPVVPPEPKKKTPSPLLKTPVAPKAPKKETAPKERVIPKKSFAKPQKEVLQKHAETPSFAGAGEPITDAQSGKEGIPGTEGTVESAAKEQDSNVIVEMSALHVIQKVAPDYPMMSRKRMEEGTVVLIVSIEKDRVTSVSVEKSSGHVRLDQAAQTAVRRWRFAPTAGTVRARIPIRFVLN